MKIKTSVEVDGSLSLSQVANATLDTNQFLVSDGGVVKYRTGTDVLSDLGIDPTVKAGVAINKGQAVYVTTADGTNIIVGKASNLTEAASSKTLGLLDATVPLNGMANVISNGLLEGLDTSTATIGDPVWLGENGNLIYGLANKPYAPKHLVYIGVITRVNLNNGEIFINVQNGFELNEIHDVDLKTVIPVNGDILGYDGTLWVNKTIATWLGYIPADDSNVVHKTGVETIFDQKTFNGTLNTTTSIFNLAAVDNFPTAGVPDAIRASAKGHNGTSNSLTTCFYGLIENNKNAGIWIENLSTAPDATNSIGFRSSFKSTSTGNNFFSGERGTANVFRVNDYGDIYGTKIILGTTVDNTIDTLQVNGSARIVNLDPTGIGGITTKLLSYSANPYGLVFRAYATGEHSIQNQRESNDADLYPLVLQPLGGSVGIGTLNLSAPGTGGTSPNLAVGGISGSVLQLRDMTSITTIGGSLGVIQFVSSYYGTPYAAANIRAVSAQGTSGGSSGGANIVFETSTGLTSEVPTERMRLLNNGNLGLGTTIPIVKLQVIQTSANPYAAHFSANNQINGVSIGTKSTNAAFIQGYTRTFGFTNDIFLQPDGGSIGIGNTFASEKLHVTGNLRVTGSFKDSNNLAGTSGQVLSSTGTGTSWITNGSGLKGIHSIIKLSSGQSTSASVSATGLASTFGSANRLTVYPYIPAQTITSASLYINVTNAVVSANAQILIYSDLNGKPDSRLYQSTTLDCSTTGAKTVTTAQTFVAGITYWIGVHFSSSQTLSGLNTAGIINIGVNVAIPVNSYYITPTFGAAPATFGTPTGSLATNPPFIGITL